MNDLTYVESVKVSWFIDWRTYLFSVVLGLITAWAEIRMDEPFQRIIMALAVFVILPIFCNWLYASTMTGSDSTLFGRHIKTLQLVPACSLILLALRFVAVSAVNAADFTGPVVSILDGDTIEVLHNNCAERISENY